MLCELSVSYLGGFEIHVSLYLNQIVHALLANFKILRDSTICQEDREREIERGEYGFTREVSGLSNKCL